jgi:hypothetical protein
MKLRFFRAGKHTAFSGQPVEFSHSEIATIAANYSPKLRAAPLILGHDPLIESVAVGQTDGLTAYMRKALSELAFGMVNSVEAVNGEMVADINPVSPRYLEMVKNGELIGLSASFFESNSTGNPTPGTRYLKHIAVLGKTPPALSNLLPLSQNFSQTNIDGIISINFSTMDVVEDLQKQNQILKLQLERGNRLSEIAATVGSLTNLPISFSAAPTDNLEFAAGQPAIYQWLLGLENHQYRFAIDLIKHLDADWKQTTNFSLLNQSVSAIATPQPQAGNSIYTGASLRAASLIEAYAKSNNVSFSEAAQRLGYV